MITKSETKGYYNIKKHIIIVFSLLVLTALETSLDILAVKNIAPHLIVCMLVLVSLSESLIITGIYGILCGAIYDVVTNSNLGTYCLVFTLICILINMIHLYYIKVNIKSFIIFITCSTFIVDFVLWANIYSQLGYLNWAKSLINIIFSIIYTNVIGILIFCLFNMLNNKYKV